MVPVDDLPVLGYRYDMGCCKIQWVARTETARKAGLFGTREGWMNDEHCSTRHAGSVDATHDVRCRFDDGTFSDWLPACSAHAEFASRFLPSWEVRKRPQPDPA